MDKKYISADELLADSFELGLKILDSGFEPKFIVGVWRGGSPVGIAVQELLEYCGVISDHIAIRTSSYTGIDTRRSTVRVHGLSYIVKHVNHEDSLLIVDDVWDTGLSIQAIFEHLHRSSRRNAPHDIRTATVYYKPAKNQTDLEPDYYVHANDSWLVFPHEMCGLSLQDVARKPGIGPYIERIATHRERRVTRRSSGGS